MTRQIWMFTAASILLLGCGQGAEKDTLSPERRFEAYFAREIDGHEYDQFIRKILADEDIPRIQDIALNREETDWKRMRAVRLLLISESKENLKFCFEFAKNGNSEDRYIFFSVLTAMDDIWKYYSPMEQEKLVKLFILHIGQENAYGNFNCHYASLFLLFRDDDLLKVAEEVLPAIGDKSEKDRLEAVLNTIRYENYLKANPSLPDTERTRTLFNLRDTDMERILRSTYANNIPPILYIPEILESVFHDSAMDMETRSKAGLLLFEIAPTAYFDRIIEYLDDTDDPLFLNEFFGKLYFYVNSQAVPPMGEWYFPESLSANQYCRLQSLFVRWMEGRKDSSELTPEEITLIDYFWNDSLETIVKDHLHSVTDNALRNRLDEIIRAGENTNRGGK